MNDVDLPSPISDLTSITNPSQIASTDYLPLAPPSLSPLLDDDVCLHNNKNSFAYDAAQCVEALRIESKNAANNKLRLHFSPKQCFGSSNQAEIVDADMLSAVQFDNRGEYLGTGDKGGRVVIFKKSSGKDVKSNGKIVTSLEYKFYAEFLSHEPEFDYLKSLEIEERINQVKWLPERSRNALFMLSTNDKTVKLWKVRERGTSLVHVMVNTQQISSGTVAPIANPSMTNHPIKHVRSLRRLNDEVKGTPRLELPRLKHGKQYVVATPSRIFTNGYIYHINSIDPSSDGEHFLASDDFRINLQNLNVTECIFNIVDIKPNLDEFTEVITSSIFLPSHNNVFLYSTSKGTINICDLRQSTTCASQAIILKETNGTDTESFASDIVASISDIRSTQDGRYIASRDYMTVKLWDTHMSKTPIRTFGVHHHLKGKLKTLHNNGCVFDKFNVVFDGAGSHVLTGSYNNICYMYSLNTDSHSKVEICKQSTRRKVRERKSIGSMSYRSDMEQRAPTRIDYDKKIEHVSWHPSDDTLAIGGQNKLYFYCGKKRKDQ